MYVKTDVTIWRIASVFLILRFLSFCFLFFPYLIKKPLFPCMTGKQNNLSVAVIKPAQGLFEALIVVHDKSIIEDDRHRLILTEHASYCHTQCKIDLLHRSSADLFQ